MQVIAVRTGRLDAAYIPEHHATVAEEYGFEMLIHSGDVWPEMQGSLLAVKESLLDEHPETVMKLVGVTQKATDWAKQNKDEAASIVAEELQATRGIGYLFQDLALFPHLDVASNVEYGLKVQKKGVDGRETRVRELLELLSITHLKERYPRELSGGERQRVALARALPLLRVYCFWMSR